MVNLGSLRPQPHELPGLHLLGALWVLGPLSPPLSRRTLAFIRLGLDSSGGPSSFTQLLL